MSYCWFLPMHLCDKMKYDMSLRHIHHMVCQMLLRCNYPENSGKYACFPYGWDQKSDSTEVLSDKLYSERYTDKLCCIRTNQNVLFQNLSIEKKKRFLRKR